MDSWNYQDMRGEKKNLTQNTQEVLQCPIIRNKTHTQKTQQIPYICYIGQTAEGNDESDF